MNAPLSDRGYIGGGNVAAILGLSPFQSPLDAYLSITNELPVELSPAKRKFFDRRKALEPFAAECFEMATGLKIVERNNRYDDPHFPWAKAEIDAEVIENGDRVNVETKTVNQSTAWQWGDPEEGEEPPLYVTAQVMWGLAVTGRQKAYVHALIGLDDDRIYEVHRDERLIEDIRAHAEKFWKYHVEPRRMPQPTTVEDLQRLYARDSGRFVEADSDAILAIEELSQAKRQLKSFENQKLMKELVIKKFMRDATTLTQRGIAIATFKSRADGVRVFRVK